MAAQLLLALSTHVTYDKNIQLFHAFCTSQGLAGGWPLSMDAVLAYCAHMHCGGLARRTMAGNQQLSLLPPKAADCIDSCRDFRVCKGLEGQGRGGDRQTDKRLPVMLIRLVEVLPVLCSFLFKAAFLLGFFRAFRFGELISRSRSDSSGQALSLENLDVAIKNRPEGDWAKRLLHNLLLILQDYLAVYPHGRSALLIHADSFPPNTQSQFTFLFQSAVMAVGIPPNRFPVH